MASKKKQSAKQKELRRIRRRISALEKRGYTVDKGFKESLTSLSWQKLRTIKPRQIYKEATVTTKYSTYSGTEYRKLERQRAARKGAETRRIRQRFIANEEEYERARTLIDYVDIAEGDIIWDRLKGLIDQFPTAGSEYLNRLLNDEVRRYGKDAVIKTLSNLPSSFISEIEAEIYYEAKKQNHGRTLRKLADAIKGTAASIKDEQEYGIITDEIDYEEEV